MKIAHIITRMILGGAQENTLLTCEGLHDRGHEVTLITGPALGPEGQLMDRARGYGYRVIEINALRRAINPVHDVPGYFHLKKLLRALDADIVHTHSAKAGILGRWAAGAVRREAGEGCCAAARALNQAQQTNRPRPGIVHTIHGLAFHPFQAEWKNRLFIAAEKSAAKSTDAFITVAQAMTDQALAAGIGQAQQYTKVLSGMEVAAFAQDPSPEDIAGRRAALGIAPEATVVVTVARLFALKGHDYVIDAAQVLAQEFPQAVWLFVGDGAWRGRLEERIGQEGLSERFKFSGLVPPEQVPELIQASDILVHCSLREGLARVLPQALLCGKPVVSFDVDGAREVVNEQTGFLLAAKDGAGLIEAQRQLIADGDLRRRLGAAGRALCREEFDHALMVERIEAVYRGLLGEARTKQ